MAETGVRKEAVSCCELPLLLLRWVCRSLCLPRAKNKTNALANRAHGPWKHQFLDHDSGSVASVQNCNGVCGTTKEKDQVVAAGVGGPQKGGEAEVADRQRPAVCHAIFTAINF